MQIKYYMLDYPKFKIRFWQGGKGFFTSSLISFSRKRKSRVLTLLYMYAIMYVILKGGDNMLNTNITNFRKNIFMLLEQTIKYNEPVNISTKDGNAVILSEEDYNGLMETLYLSSIPGMKEKIVEGLNTPLEDCIAEDKVSW